MRLWKALLMVLVAVIMLSATAVAQPISGTGCPGAARVGGPNGIKTPGSSVFTPPTSPFPNAPGVLLVGFVGPSTALPMPPACAPGTCVIGCTILAAVPMPTSGLTLTSPSVPAILPLCIQYVAVDPSCLWLSKAVKIQLFPC